jgi:hypothetical protein
MKIESVADGASLVYGKQNGGFVKFLAVLWNLMNPINPQI